MYNIDHVERDNYLKDLLPPKVFELSNYPLTNGENYSIPRFRLSKTNASFFPSTLRAWNELNLVIRNLPSINRFKNSLHKKRNFPLWYLYGSRKLIILHTKIRNNNSSLNYDLCRFGLREDPGCRCGFQCENSFHYFLECPLFTQIRNNLFVILRIYGEISLDIIKYGSENLSVEENLEIFAAVHEYIRNSHCFD